MADINKVVLVGRLTRDAEQSYTQNGYAVVKFSIAVNRRRKQDDQWVDEANFFDIASFGKQGEAIASYLTKGRQVAVEGQLRQGRWEAPDGTKRSKVSIDASYVQLIGGRDSGTSSPGADFESSGSWGGQDSSPPPNQAPPAAAPDLQNFEDDIPF